MKTDRFQHFLETQKHEMEKYKWEKGVQMGKDPGRDAIQEWIQKYAKKFRKDFALGDLKDACDELRKIRLYIQEYIDKIAVLNRIINSCEEKIIEGIELLESEKENSNGDAK